MASTPVYPVTYYRVQFHEEQPLVFLTMDFLAHPMQSPREATPGRRYALVPAEARKLAQRILAVCDQVESRPPVPVSGPKH